MPLIELLAATLMLPIASRPICSGSRLTSCAIAGSAASRSDCQMPLHQFSGFRLVTPETERRRTTAARRRRMVVIPPMLRVKGLNRSVPRLELTGDANIKLNGRVSLRRRKNQLKEAPAKDSHSFVFARKLNPETVCCDHRKQTPKEGPRPWCPKSVRYPSRRQ